MKTISKAIISFLTIIIITVGLLFIVYRFNSFPSVKTFIDNYILSRFNGFIEKQIENEPEAEIQNEQIIELQSLPFINDCSIQISKTEQNNFQHNLDDYKIPQIQIITSNNDYSITFTGDYDFAIDFEYPIVSKPYIFADSICIFTADNFLNIINIKNKNIEDKIQLNFIVDCDTNLREPLFVTENSFVIKAIDGTAYIIDFGESQIDYSDDLQYVPSDSSSLINQFLPNETVQKFMISQINTWGFESKIGRLPYLEFFTGSEMMPIDDMNVHLFVYSPDIPNHYEIALTDEKSKLVRGNAIIAIFSERGDLMSVSLDYVADKPLVSATLSETEFYYIVAGWACVDKNDFKTTYVCVSESLGD